MGKNFKAKEEKDQGEEEFGQELDIEQIIQEQEDKIKKQEKKKKHKMLGLNTKKHKRLMKRFQDDDNSDENDENEKKDKPKKQIAAQTAIKQKNNSKSDYQKTKKQILTEHQVTQENQSNSEQIDIEPKVKPQPEKPERLFIKDIFQQIISQDVKKEFQNNPILSNNRKHMTSIKQEFRKEREVQLRKKIALLKQQKGYLHPLRDDPVKEKEMKIIATKGIIKIFEAIKKFQNENEE